MRTALSVASECAPLVKTGGLADVVGALPAALASQGWQLRTLIPGYPSVMSALEGAEEVWAEDGFFGGRGRIVAARRGTLDLLVLDAPHLYDREGSIYLGPWGGDWPDNPERFAALCWAAARIATGALGDWRPEVVHAHDWQAGFVGTYLRGSGVPTVMTVHNIAFQGHAPPERMESLRLPSDRFRAEGFEFYGGINALKAGLVEAAAITTVSPTYARELTGPRFGLGLEGVIAARSGVLHGILNGIDTDVWSPRTDPHLVATYAVPRGKGRNRAALIEEFGIAPGAGPLAIVVSRLTAQKGFDLLWGALPRFLAAGGALALLGSGAPEIENAFRDLAAREPAVGVRIGYDEALSHRMYAGGDAVLVPSRFEPCGLTQLYGLRYGAVPVVARTGGLADTVIDANDAALRAGVATGVQVAPDSVEALAHGLERLCAHYQQSEVWSRLQRNGMRHPVDWAPSAAEYAALYARVAD